MNKRLMLVLCIVVAAIGIVIAFSGGIGERAVFTPKVMLGIILAACGMGGAMGISIMAAGLCMASALIFLAMAGVTAGSVLLCCIPATMLTLHLVNLTGNC